jgi:hypothetical protein
MARLAAAAASSGEVLVKETLSTREPGSTCTSMARRTASASCAGLGGLGRGRRERGKGRGAMAGLKLGAAARLSWAAICAAAGRLAMTALWLATTAPSSRLGAVLPACPGTALFAGS